MNRIFVTGVMVLSIGVSGCMSAGKHREAVRDDTADRIPSARCRERFVKACRVPKWCPYSVRRTW